MTGRRGLAASAGIAAVLVCFALPLFVGLREPDMRSDEAIYSYAVERILETGDWLTPRSIPSDEPFLEKPPLKLWLVAGGMAARLLPRDEAGMRMFDALFGAVGFLYVYLLGRRLDGTACGLVAVLTLFAIDALLFEHGLRSNNMEAAVFLSYCGGVFHFLRWIEAAPERRGRGDALAVALYFTLGFMTKFVAALFLPLVLIAALAWRPGAFRLLRGGWTHWILPVILVPALSLPWFVYEFDQFGARFWGVIFGAHVYQRFTSSVDPAHVHAWNYYVTAVWFEIRQAGVQLLTIGGLARLVFMAWRGEPWLARLTLIWLVLPLLLMSLGTSKLLHYAYPFLPPLGLAAGAAAAAILRALDGDTGVRLTGGLTRVWSRLPDAWARHGSRVRRALLAVALALVALSVWTVISGMLLWEWHGIQLFRNSSPIRPLILAAVLAALATYSTSVARLVGGVGLAALLPLHAYSEALHQIPRTNHPLRATRDCVASVQAGGARPGAGVLSASGDILHHSYYYYFWRLGPWTIAPHFDAATVLERVTVPEQFTPVVLTRGDFAAIQSRLPPDVGVVRDHDENVILLPGPFAPCVAPIVGAGGKRVAPLSR